jgi:hypothetical protein
LVSFRVLVQGTTIRRSISGENGTNAGVEAVAQRSDKVRIFDM